MKHPPAEWMTGANDIIKCICANIKELDADIAGKAAIANLPQSEEEQDQDGTKE